MAVKGSAQCDLRAFPIAGKRDAGRQLDQVQNGLEPDDWKPIATIGAGVREIRIRDSAGAFSVMYGAKFIDAIDALYCFHKKMAKTSQTDTDLTSKRYRDLKQELEQ